MHAYSASSHFIDIHQMALSYAADHAPWFLLDFDATLLTYLLNIAVDGHWLDERYVTACMSS